MTDDYKQQKEDIKRQMGVFAKFHVTKIKTDDESKEMEFKLIDPQDTHENAIQVLLSHGCASIWIPRQSSSVRCDMPHASPERIIVMFSEEEDLYDYFKDHGQFNLKSAAFAAYCALKTVCQAWAKSPDSHGCPVACRICELCGGTENRMVTQISPRICEDNPLLCSLDDAMDMMQNDDPQDGDVWTVKFVLKTGKEIREMPEHEGF